MIEIELGSYRCPFELWTPAMGRIFDSWFAYDTETTDIDQERPYLTPAFVLGTACNDKQGVFLTRETAPLFFAVHEGVRCICHNAAFDLKVTQALLGNQRDLYAMVDANKIWDTLILKRLFSLATTGHTARGEAGLADCVKVHLGLDLDKQGQDAQGNKVRTSFGQYLGKPFSDIPVAYLRYAAADPLATWHLFWKLHELIKQMLRNSSEVFGYVDEPWLKEAISCFGPLTHHVQLKASIVMDAINANGIGIDQARQVEKATRVQMIQEAARERLRQRGYLAGESGSAKAMQSILSQLKRRQPSLELKTTPSGKWSTAEEDLAGLADQDGFFADYAVYRTAEKLLSTYLIHVPGEGVWCV